ncbi:TRAP transporter small permease [Rubrobacter taiwanensis]|uniref:TRAP transporter small permease n=1 Tax=Rubrobacter taiwanensis TaxID=185139 RepID=A0A4R1B6U3_9ACTN|nr:TRAP transporter small permease [Rubrobacter taiwanensis]TCJ13480.1 TRAP transporter small permease [Rubrobacter taiwanensis]
MEEAERRVAADPEALSPEEAARQEREEEAALPPLFRWLDIGFKSLLVALFCVLILAVGANVAGRYLFGFSLAWADELARFLFIWIIFVGAALAFFRGEHISVTYLVERLPRRLAYALGIVKNLLVLVILLVILLGAWQVMTVRPGTSALLNVPLNWVNVSVPIGAGLMVLMCVYRIVLDIWALAKREG